LPNRLSIERRGAAFLNDARFNRSGLALLILNVDDVFDFDQESTLPRSDDALKHIGKTLLSAVPDPTCVARTGVDEFVLLVPQSHGADEVGHFAQRLLDSLARPQLLDGRTFKVCATAGVALFPEDGDHMDALLGKARAALRAAQAVTPGGYQFHLAEITQRHRESRQLENELREAISGDSLTLKYQPQFDVSSGRVCGVEALTRWTRADGRVISPSVFIPLAEKCRSIEALGQWALRASCKTFASWPSSSIDAPLCVNVSVEQIAPRFTEMIREALLESGLRPDRLELEITESVLVGSTDHVLACLNDWKRLGVRIAIDDFGTGYSNLAYLSKLPIDRLKIDKSLTARVPGDHRDSTVVRTVISLARELGFTVLAEGIENEEQLRAVTDLGCHQVQGFLFAPPLTAPQALELMTSRWGLREQASIPA
ncbi:MAG TPA: bifunctional diguanylate cyclase/phosphodiesterase, partial [Steroidobacteraceae bacterium]|nr:bifunctional diguanylate cyclase/phosphodiesterase [Steroidobacteraceae bacterium]